MVHFVPEPWIIRPSDGNDVVDVCSWFDVSVLAALDAQRVNAEECASVFAPSGSITSLMCCPSLPVIRMTLELVRIAPADE